jgi:hypothetical protein
MPSNIESAIQQRLHVIEQQIDAVDAKRHRLNEERIALYQRHSELSALLQTITTITTSEDGA